MIFIPFKTLSDGVDASIQRITIGQIRLFCQIPDDNPLFNPYPPFLDGMDELTVYRHLIASFKVEFQIDNIFKSGSLYGLTNYFTFTNKSFNFFIIFWPKESLKGF